jgi:hypothetical protein
MSDRITSWLRTVVPGLWSALITAVLVWAGTHAPWLVRALDTLNIDLTSEIVVGFVVSAVLAGWYALWRWIEPRLPDWLTRILLGSAQQPVYPTTAAALPVLVDDADPRGPPTP